MRRRFGSFKAPDGFTVKMDENGIDIDGALGHSQLKWAAMLPPVVRADGVLIKFSRMGGTWLPDSARTATIASRAMAACAASSMAPSTPRIPIDDSVRGNSAAKSSGRQARSHL